MAKPYLMALPDELIECIAKHLTFSATLALRWTSRRFYFMVQENDVDNEAVAGRCRRFSRPLRILCLDKVHDLLLIERWPAFSAKARASDTEEMLAGGRESEESLNERNKVKQYWKDMYTCSLCLKLRPASTFSTAMTKGKRAKLSGEEVVKNQTTGQMRRFCIKCGIKDGRYGKGLLLQLADDFPLRAAGELVSAIVCRRCSKLHTVAADSREQLRRTCSDCLAYRPPKLG